jgi:hypothetical protein
MTVTRRSPENLLQMLKTRVFKGSAAQTFGVVSAQTTVKFSA